MCSKNLGVTPCKCCSSTCPLRQILFVLSGEALCSLQVKSLTSISNELQSSLESRRGGHGELLGFSSFPAATCILTSSSRFF